MAESLVIAILRDENRRQPDMNSYVGAKVERLGAFERLVEEDRCSRVIVLLQVNPPLLTVEDRLDPCIASDARQRRATAAYPLVSFGSVPERRPLESAEHPRSFDLFDV